jgi:hypothetical protein
MQTPWAGLARSSVLGVRPSALIRSRVPGDGYLEPGTGYPFESSSHSVTPILHPVSCIPRVRVFRRQVPGTGYPVSGTGYLAPGTWYPAPEPVRRRGPDTEHRRPGPAPARSGDSAMEG